MNHSLEEERKAILERMDASRRSLRQMLSDEEEHKRPFAANTFPRSHTFKFLTRHPYLVGLAVVAVVAALPRGSLKKAAKGSAAVTAGMLRHQMKASVINRILPSMLHLMRSGER
jgi:hypothetical protein